MARELSTIIQSVLSSATHNVFYAYDITLADDATVRGAEVELTVDALNIFGTSVPVTPVLYEARLNKEPSIKFTRGTAPNGGDFSITDLQHDLGVLVSQLENILEGARIVVTKCFQKANGNFEADIYFIGVVRDVKAEDDVTVVTIIADTDNRNIRVADRSLTQRCLAIFGDDRCGRPALLIGPGETCSNIYDDAENGCLAKRWQFRYWGVPILRLLTDISGNGGWGTGGGPGRGRGYCPTVDSFFSIYKTQQEIVSIQGQQLREGMITRDAMGRTAAIDKIEIMQGVRCYRLELQNGAALKCSYDHPIITDETDVTGTAVSMLSMDSTVRGYTTADQQRFVERIKSRHHIGRRDVLRVTLSNRTDPIYSAGETPDMMIDGHNYKASYDIQ